MCSRFLWYEQFNHIVITIAELGTLSDILEQISFLNHIADESLFPIATFIQSSRRPQRSHFFLTMTDITRWTIGDSR